MERWKEREKKKAERNISLGLKLLLRGGIIKLVEVCWKYKIRASDPSVMSSSDEDGEAAAGSGRQIEKVTPHKRNKGIKDRPCAFTEITWRTVSLPLCVPPSRCHTRLHVYQ